MKLKDKLKNNKLDNSILEKVSGGTGGAGGTEVNNGVIVNAEETTVIHLFIWYARDAEILISVPPSIPSS